MEIAEIKQNLSILEVIKHYGHIPNRNHLIKCPFHQDDKPSLQLYPKTNTWHCFGCGKGTDTIDFIKYSEQCNTHEAINKAKDLLQYIPTKTIKPMNKAIPTKEITVRQSTPLTPEQRTEILSKAFTYFARSMKGRDDASTRAASPKQYLQNRALDINKITVGYDAHLFHKSKEVTTEIKEHYLQAGLIYPDKLGRPNNYHSFFDGCIVFPTYNEKGEIVNLYGRCVDESKESKHRYLPGKHQGIYPKYPKTETEKLILTECIIDAATLVQLRITNNQLRDFEVIACYGTNNFTVEHQTAIKNLQALKEIILFYDGDKAGREAIQSHTRIIRELLNTCGERSRTVKVSYVETPDHEDINSLLQGHEPAVFTELLNNRKHLSHNTHDNFFLSSEKQENKTPTKPEELMRCTELTQENTIENKQEERKTFNEIKNAENFQTCAEQNRSINSSSNSQINSFSNFQISASSNLNTDNPEQLIYENETLTVTIWGGIEYYNIKKLRVTLHLQSRNNEYLEYRDTVDLYSNSHTQRLIREAAEKLETGTNAMSKTITELTKALEQYRQKERDKERKREEAERNKNRETFTQQELQQGYKFLKDKDLMQKTEQHIHNIGLVGEEEKGMLLFFILLTRMFREPLHALVQGKSGSGKTYLLKKIASLVPKAHIRITTALTENTLYHSLKDFWKHMILLIEDLDGAFNALLPLREMMSNQNISKYSTEKNLKTGEFEPKFLYVEGPVCVAGATTKDKLYEDNANRSFLIQVNESSEHQEKVLEYQRKEIAGLLDKNKEQYAQTILKTAQLHLEPLEVVIPFGEELRIPDYVFKKLRTNAHYLTLIKAIAFWNQKQREINQKADGTKYIEATLEDVSWANKLSKEVLLRKSDELNGTLRGFFESLKTWLKTNKAESFYAKQVRERLRMHPVQVNRYLKELEQRSYLKQTSGNRKTGFEYTVNVWDDYEQLKSGINVLDETLENIVLNQSEEQKEKYDKTVLKTEEIEV